MNGTRKFHIKRRYKVLGLLLGVLLSIPLLCIGVFVFGAYYGQWRMAEVNHELFALAEQLEYTPDALLQHRVRTRDHNIVFPGNADCETVLYYTAALDPVSFAQKLHLARPELTGSGTHYYNDHLYSYIPVAVSAADAQQVQEDFRRGYMNSYRWGMLGENPGSVTLFETSNMSVTLQYNGRDIQDNIVRLDRSGGAFPFWMDCPVKITESGTLKTD